MSSSDLRPIVSFEVVPEHCIRNDQLELILGTPINQVICFESALIFTCFLGH